jgi:anti-sigma regulatory factor (Ser/Thr protein kinase)
MEIHSARLRESFSHGVSDDNELDYGSLSRDAFPRGGGSGFGSARPFENDVELEVELDSGPEAAAEARTAVTALDGRADPHVLEDVRLLVSEVVTNSVRHADTPRGARVGLRLEAAADAVRVEVTDAGHGFEPQPRRASAMEAGGWGLHLVDRLASRWGVDSRNGSRVWFEIQTG